MHKHNRDEAGLAHLVLIIMLVIISGIIGFATWQVFNNEKPKQDQNNPVNSSKDTGVSFVEWGFNGESWKAMGSAPKCEEPLTISSPMDISKANARLMPGQMRGNDFKPHGGLAMNASSNNIADITAIRDAYLYRGSRYIQDNEVQYMFDFMDSCGVMYRLDHLGTLTDEFASYAAKLPEPKADDSRTHKFDDKPLIKKGTLIATTIGIKHNKNAFFDLGVYDLRAPNAASKTNLYKTDGPRISDKEQSFFALCWFDLLQGNDKTIANNLPSRGGAKESTSDYCQ